jgi:hypothetical protein
MAAAAVVTHGAAPSAPSAPAAADTRFQYGATTQTTLTCYRSRKLFVAQILCMLALQRSCVCCTIRHSLLCFANSKPYAFAGTIFCSGRLSRVGAGNAVLAHSFALRRVYIDLYLWRLCS